MEKILLETIQFLKSYFITIGELIFKPWSAKPVFHSKSPTTKYFNAVIFLIIALLLSLRFILSLKNNQNIVPLYNEYTTQLYSSVDKIDWLTLISIVLPVFFSFYVPYFYLTKLLFKKKELQDIVFKSLLYYASLSALVIPGCCFVIIVYYLFLNHQNIYIFELFAKNEQPQLSQLIITPLKIALVICFVLPFIQLFNYTWKKVALIGRIKAAILFLTIPSILYLGSYFTDLRSSFIDFRNKETKYGDLVLLNDNLLNSATRNPEFEISSPTLKSSMIRGYVLEPLTNPSLNISEKYYLAWYGKQSVFIPTGAYTTHYMRDGGSSFSPGYPVEGMTDYRFNLNSTSSGIKNFIQLENEKVNWITLNFTTADLYQKIQDSTIGYLEVCLPVMLYTSNAEFKTIDTLRLRLETNF